MLGTKEKQVLSDLIAIINALDLPMMLVGAGARLLIFDRHFVEGRGTTDWDVAVLMDSWDAYEKLSEALTGGEPPRFQSTKTLHKFRHLETSIEVDIVPFGKISDPDQQIVWSDSENSMNVAGFSEAMSCKKTIHIDELEVDVVDLPAFVVLKIFAWGDRGGRTNKDLEDIDFILSNYENDDRVYDELAGKLADGTVDFLDANIYLLGQDIDKMLERKTRLQLDELLNKLLKKFSHEPGSFGHRLKILKEGINAFPSADNDS